MEVLCRRFSAWSLEGLCWSISTESLMRGATTHLSAVLLTGSSSIIWLMFSFESRAEKLFTANKYRNCLETGIESHNQMIQRLMGVHYAGGGRKTVS